MSLSLRSSVTEWLWGYRLFIVFLHFVINNLEFFYFLLQNAEENAATSPATEAPKPESEVKPEEAKVTNGDATPEEVKQPEEATKKEEEVSKPAEEPVKVEEAKTEESKPAVEEAPKAEEPAVKNEENKEVRNDDVPPPLPSSNPPSSVTVFAQSTRAETLAVGDGNVTAAVVSASVVDLILEKPIDQAVSSAAGESPSVPNPEQSVPEPVPNVAGNVEETKEAAEEPKVVEPVQSEEAPKVEESKPEEPEAPKSESSAEVTENVEVKESKTDETQPETAKTEELAKAEDTSVKPEEPISEESAKVEDASSNSDVPKVDEVAKPEQELPKAEETVSVEEPKPESTVAEPVEQPKAEELNVKPEESPLPPPSEPEVQPDLIIEQTKVTVASTADGSEPSVVIVEKTRTVVSESLPETVNAVQGADNGLPEPPPSPVNSAALPAESSVTNADSLSTESLPSLPEPTLDSLAEPMSLPPADIAPEPITDSFVEPPKPSVPSGPESISVLTNGNSSNGLPTTPEESPASVDGPLKQVNTADGTQYLALTPLSFLYICWRLCRFNIKKLQLFVLTERALC